VHQNVILETMIVALEEWYEFQKDPYSKTNIQGPKKIWVPKSIWLYEWWTPWSEVETLIAVAPNTWWEMHQILFIFLPKIVNMWFMETTNKDHLINKPNEWYQMIPKCHLSLIDYFWLFLSMMIVFKSYVDCLWWLFLIEFWLSLMIVFYDCSWLSFDCL